MTIAEEKKESNPQEEEKKPQETSEHAPAEEEEQTEKSESESPEGEEESKVEGSEPEGEEAQTEDDKEKSTEELQAELDESNRLRDEYKKDLLELKKGKYGKALELDLEEGEKEVKPETKDEPEKPKPEVSNLLWDYKSKRSDVRGELEEKFGTNFSNLPSGQFEIFRTHLGSLEKELLAQAKKRNEPVAKRQVEGIFKEALDYSEYKVKPQKESTLPPGADVGSTTTIRKVTSTPKISEKAKALQPHTKDPKTGKIVSLETIQGMIDRGEIN